MLGIAPGMEEKLGVDITKIFVQHYTAHELNCLILPEIMLNFYNVVLHSILRVLRIA